MAVRDSRTAARRGAAVFLGTDGGETPPRTPHNRNVPCAIGMGGGGRERPEMGARRDAGDGRGHFHAAQTGPCIAKAKMRP